MIEKIKTITYEVRSHGQRTIISSEGLIERAYWDIKYEVKCSTPFKKPGVVIKKTIWHLLDVLKVLNKIEKEKKEKKMKNSQDNIPKL